MGTVAQWRVRAVFSNGDIRWLADDSAGSWALSPYAAIEFDREDDAEAAAQTAAARDDVNESIVEAHETVLSDGVDPFPVTADAEIEQR